jgi:sulfopyruvate decarboxylase subunit alpha
MLDEEEGWLVTRQQAIYSELMLEGLLEAGVSLVTAIPESLLRGAYHLLDKTDRLKYVKVANEAEMPGICAGAYLAGSRAVMIMENSGLRQACEPLARLSFAHHVPMVLFMSHRGALGEKNWWGHNHAQTMQPILEALRFPYWYVTVLDEIKPHIARAWDHADSSQWPVTLIFSGECVEGPRHAAD